MEKMKSYYPEKESSDYKNLCRVVDMYMEKHPRELHYSVHLTSTEDDSEGGYYHTLSPEELLVLRKCTEDAKENDCSLAESMEYLGHEDLLKKLVQNNSVYQLDYVESVDLANPVKLSFFDYRLFSYDGQFIRNGRIGVELTDEEHRDIFIKHIYHHNCYSFNNVLANMPEIGMKVTDMLVGATNCGMENVMPTVCFMNYFRDAVESIFNPFKDELGLFSGDDEELKAFAVRYQIESKV